MTKRSFWRERHKEFLAEAIRFAELKAKWTAYFGGWRLWWGSKGARVPQECLQALTRVTQEAINGIPDSHANGETEPWVRWLEFMRRGTWRGLRVTGHCAVSELVWEAGVKIGRPPVVVRRELRLSTGDEPEADHWLEDLTLENVFRASAEFCDELSRTLELLAPEAVELKTAEPASAGSTSIVERSKVRRTVVLPILASKRWTRGKWATKAGVSKNSVYEYLNGKRKLTQENRKALADVLGLKPEDLPE